MLTHLAHFHEDDPTCCAMQVSFLSAALRQGETGLVLATPAHRSALALALVQCGLNEAQAASTGHGHCVMLDAQQTLSRFMVREVLDEALFHAVMTELILHHVPPEGRRVWVCSEMAGLLAAEGKGQAAVRLEACWGVLARANRRLAFSSLCSYPQHVLDQAANRRWIPAICRAHSGVCLPR